MASTLTLPMTATCAPGRSDVDDVAVLQHDVRPFVALQKQVVQVEVGNQLAVPANLDRAEAAAADGPPAASTAFTSVDRLLTV